MLTSKQRARLSRLAQTMDSHVTLGKGGASPELTGQLARLLETHELVKLRFACSKEARRELAASLASSTQSEVVRMVGFVAVFWKANPKPDRRKIDIGEAS